MEIQCIDDLHSLFEEYQNRVECLFSMAEKQKNQKAMDILQKVSVRLRQGPIRTVVLGVSSAGKSTLINAVCGNIVVPEGKRTTSPVPVWVCCNTSDEDSAEVGVIKRENSRIVDLKLGRFQYLQEYCYNSSEAGRGDAQQKFQDLIAARVNVGSAYLKNSGITLIDTPGLGASEGDDSRLDSVLADGCEMLIILYKTLQLEYVKDYFRKQLDAEGSLLARLWSEGKVFFVRNRENDKPDNFLDKDDENHIIDIFGAKPPEDRRFAVAALKARLLSCGCYPSAALLPEGYSAEDKKHADETLKEEKKVQSKHMAKVRSYVRSLKMAVYKQEDICSNLPKMEEILDGIMLDIRSFPDVDACICQIENLLIHPSREIRSVLRRLRDALQCQISLQQLWRSLNQKKDEICGEPWEIKELLNPIRAQINQVVSILEEPLEKQRRDIESAEYPASLNLVKKRDELEKRTADLIAFHSQVNDRLNHEKNDSQRNWPIDKLVTTMQARKELNREYLLSDSFSGAQAVIRDKIGLNHGPYELAILLKKGLRTFRTKLMSMLGNPSGNPEIQYWQDYFHTLSKSIDDVRDLCSREEDAKRIETFLNRTKLVLSEAKTSASAALQTYDGFELSSEDFLDLVSYLTDKQNTIRHGGLLGRLARFSLLSSLEADKLNTIYLKAVKEGTTAYMTAFRESLWQQTHALYPQCREILLKACVELKIQINTVQKEIEDGKKNAKQLRIDEWSEKKKQMDALRI